MRSKRFYTFILAGILFLSGVGTIPCALAESTGEVSKGTETEDIIPASYPNLLRPLDEWMLNNDSIAFNQVQFAVSIINGRIVALPIFFRQLTYVKQEGEDTKGLSEKDLKKYKENFEYLKKHFSPDQIELIEDYGTYDVLKEFSELQIITYKYFNPDNKSRIIEVVNKEYYKNIQYYTIPQEVTIEFIFRYLGIENKINEIPEDILSGERKISREEFVEIYKKIIPRKYWPIIERKKVNYNPTFPKLKDEILDLSIKKLKLCQTEKDNKVKYLLGTLDEKGNLLNFISGEVIEYINPKDNESNNIIYPYFLTYRFANQFDFESVLKDLPDYAEEFLLVKTYRDAVDFIQMFPIEEQFDYSVFDLSGNPDIDPAWLANRPTSAPTPVPTPTPTPPPYAELTIGSSGKEVLDLKQRFYELGYFRTTSFNDRFTDNTADTVKLFEKNNGLPVDGMADAEMLGVLFSDGAVGK